MTPTLLPLSPMDTPKGKIVFTTVGIPYYGFDVFSLPLPSSLPFPSTPTADTRLTDALSINYNAQFADDSGSSVVFVSERTGAFALFLTRPGLSRPDALPSAPGSLFHDRPSIRGGRLYFTSTHEPAAEHFRSWSAVYSTDLGTRETVRLTPAGTADFSPAVSAPGDAVAVASYGSKSWSGDFHELNTEIVVFRPSDPGRRVAIASGGWPTWAGDSTLFFHRKADDGWWSVYRVDLDGLKISNLARRVTPPGLHAFTPSATADGRWIAVATRRRGRKTRQVEIYDLEAEVFHPVTELINPNLHHYNPFFSPDSTKLGYHRFRGESSDPNELAIRHLERVASPIPSLRMLRLFGSFPSFSPGGEFMAINGDFENKPGLMIIRSDGSKWWSLIKNPSAFYTSWSPTEEGVVYTSLGPIFDNVRATVQIARVSFDVHDLAGGGEGEFIIASEVKMLTREETGNNAFPSCSPDGRNLVFRSGRNGQKNLYILDAVKGESADGNGIRRLTEGDWIDTMPSWSPRGDLIAFSSNRHRPDNPEVFSIYLGSPDGTGLRRVLLAGAEWADRERVNHVCFSPDGEWLLFTANLGAVTAEPISMPNQFQPYGDLHVCRLDGSGLARLTRNGYENGTPAWVSDGGEEEAGVELIGRLALKGGVGDSMKGQFDEPLWLTCDNL